MSQIRFRSGLFRVLTGWDRPNQDHFLVVERGKDTVVYSNLSDPTLPFPGAMTVDQVISKLRELEIVVPTQLRADLEEHQRRNVGNLAVNYGDSYQAE